MRIFWEGAATVRELIERLEEFDAELPVSIFRDEEYRVELECIRIEEEKDDGRPKRVLI